MPSHDHLQDGETIAFGTSVETRVGRFRVQTDDTFDQGWETMVFDNAQPGVYSGYAVDIRRYRNQKQAFLGHVEMVRKWAAKPWWKTAKSYGRGELSRRASSNRRNRQS